MSLYTPQPPCTCPNTSVFVSVALGTVPPQIAGSSPEHVTAVLNSSATLPCEVHAQPSAEVTWFKERQPVTLGPGRFLLPGG